MMWRTPSSSDGEGGVIQPQEGKDMTAMIHYKLRDDAAMWLAAPQSPSSLHSETTQTDGHVCSPKCRKLNPLFVELHMGVPMGFSSMKTGSIDSDRWETWWSLSRERLRLLISHTKPDCMMGVNDED